MRTVIIGSDFVYNKDGNLVPIEINTNIGWSTNQIENPLTDELMDLSGLTAFITQRNFTKVVVISSITILIQKLQVICDNLGIIFELIPTSTNAITIPYVEDNDETLIVRSSYDTTALVDDTYCRDKIEFMNLIKDSAFGSQFAYRDTNSVLVNNITTINNNGTHPNFILKSILPAYDKEVYPKLFKVTTQEELNIVLNNVDSLYFLMEFHFNEATLYNDNQLKVYRGITLLVPPALESIYLGGYTLLTNQNLVDVVSTYDNTTYELSYLDRIKYLTNDRQIRQPKVLDTDLVELSDGTFKSALELEIGDELKTIDIPNPNNVNLTTEINKFGISYETLLAGTTYSANKLTAKQRINSMVLYIQVTFTDGSTWEDTGNSSYLCNVDGEIAFIRIYSLKLGDKIILIDTTDGNLNIISKEVVSITTTKQLLTGWLLEVERQHLFLTKTTSTNNESFVTIEHNNVFCSGDCQSNSYYCSMGTCANKGCMCIKNYGTYDEPCDGTGGEYWYACICSDNCVF